MTASGFPASQHDERDPEDVVLSVLAGREPLNVHVQPIVDLERGVVAGYEALARFPGLRPDLAFEAAGRLGHRAELQALAASRALELRDRLPANTFLTINIDPADLGDTALLTVLLAHTPLTRVVIELTEHSAVDLDTTADLLADLRKAGAMIAADDVGAGYAGMQALLALRPQMLKLDRSLISNLDEDPVKQELVRMLGDFAGRMDAWVLGEGIETVRELQVLGELAVPLGQGYLLGRPQPGWAAVDHGLRRELRRAQMRRQQRSVVHSLLEPVATEDADRAPHRAEVDDLVVQVDEWGRPVAVRMPAGWGPTDAEPMVVQLSEGIDTLAARLSVQGGRGRAVVVVVHPNGELAGIVRPQRVLAALLPTP